MTAIPVVHRFLVVMYLNGMLGGSILASGIATRALFALLPGLLLVVAFVGFVARDPAVQERVVELIAELVPPLAGLVSDSLDVIKAGAVPFTIIGLVTLLWAASGFFQTLEVAFSVILGIERRRDPIIRGAIGLAGVGIILALVGFVVLLLALVASFAPSIAARVLDPAVSQLVTFVLLALAAMGATVFAYRFIPSTRPDWSAVALPGIVVGLGVTILTELFTVIAPHLAGVASLYGAIAAVFVLLAWLQLAANLIVMGMAWIRTRVQGEPPAATMGWPTGSLNHPGPPAPAAVGAGERDAGP